MYTYIGGHTCAIACGGAEDNLQELVFSTHHACPRVKFRLSSLAANAAFAHYAVSMAPGFEISMLVLFLLW